MGGGGNVWGSVIQSASGILQSVEGANVSARIRDEQLQANAAARASRADQYSKTQAYLDPYSAAGGRALSKAEDYLGTSGNAYDSSQFEMDPGYQWRMEQGQKALERSASAKGMLGSGGMLKALQNYSQGLASQEFNNSYNRLMGMANMGYNSASQQAGYSNA